ncbi:signal peptidase I [Niallia sp.]|uniref:signal peptidase I n=1 Tax=Niallia sp. TaxID=2837523 RepID=UPI00289B84C4|nr:signal peptidase I [Niallia sp.]
MATEKKKKNEVWEWSKALIIAVLLAFVIRYFLFAPIVVDGESMQSTLLDQDRMIVNKINYKVSEPKRFDIIVFHAPEGKDYIKRVIGLPGDTIEYRNDVLYVNGQAYEEPYLEHNKQDINGPLTEDFTATVPDGELFVMGDNRRNSKDSRHIGTIGFDKIIGSTSVVYWPVSDLKIVE